MEFTVGQIATLLNGEVIGNADSILKSFSKIEEGREGTLSFLSNTKYLNFLYESKATAILINKDIEISKPVKASLIKVDDAYQALATLTDLYVSSLPRKKGIEQPSYVSERATLGADCYVGAFAYIGENAQIGDNVLIYPQAYIGDNVKIGNNTIVYSGVKLYENSQIGENCILHSGCVIGGDGFGFAKQEDGKYKKLHQLGNVVLGDEVEIGANTTIDCATMGSTIIKDGVKLDDQVMIGHNVVIGENTVMAAQVGIAGSTVVGDNCVFGGQVGVSGHIKIGNNVTAGGKTGIPNNVKDGVVLLGDVGMEFRKFARVNSVYRNLPELWAEVKAIKKQLKNK